jgi:hypothetical protein
MSAVAVVAGAVAMASPSLGSIDKCQKAVAGVHLKLEASITKALNKCADGYQKATLKGDPLTDISGKCSDGLAKAIDLSNPSSAMGKAKAKLADLVTKGTCVDSDLQALGHLPAGTFGDRWQRSVLISALDSAYTAAQAANGGLVSIMNAINDAGGCSQCPKVVNPPCFAHACILDGTSGGEVHNTGSPISFALAGSISIGVCNVPSINTPNEYTVLGSPSKGFDTVTVIPGLAFACVTAFRTEGILTCGGTAPRINYTLCQDHIVTDLGGGIFVDECETGGPNELCQADSDDPAHPGVINGGPCLNATTAAASPGDAFFLATTKIQVVLNTEVGPDTIPCTADDTVATPAVANQLPQTTGSASAQVLDANNVEATTISSSALNGSPFNCAQVATSNTSGGKTVSTLPALHALLGNDLTTQSTLSCQ